MPMPINGLWTVRMAVTRRMPEDTAGESVVLRNKDNNDTTTSNKSKPEASGASADSGGGEEFDHDPTDWVSVRMGPSLTTLHHVADIKNVVNDDLGEVKRFCSCGIIERIASSFSCVGGWEVRGGVLSKLRPVGDF